MIRSFYFLLTERLLQATCSTGRNLIWIFRTEGKQPEIATLFQKRITGIEQPLRLHLFTVQRGFIEGWERVHWGLGGVNLIEPSLNPLSTLNGISLISEWIMLKFRIYSHGVNCKKTEQVRKDRVSSEGSALLSPRVSQCAER